MDIRINDITIGERVRKDFGNLEPLAESIRELGLLQPIGVTAENLLVFGERRLRAVRDYLDWETIPARVVNIEAIILGEYAENELRKDFTVSERVAIGKQIEALLAGRRGSNQYRLKELPQNFGEALLGKETADVAAEKAGFGNPETYRQAKRVVEEGSDALIEAVDDGLAVSTAEPLLKLTAAQIDKLRAEGIPALKRMSKEIRAEEAEERRADRMEKFKGIGDVPPLPADGLGTFPILYADPPWRYDYAETESRAIENQYPRSP